MSHTLLLADDSVTIQRFIELTFADEDISVIAVGNGDHAIASIRHTPPDIVLADVSMPGQSGYEVARQIKQTPALAHIPVLLLTGAFEPIDQARAAEVGCDGVLTKPFEPHAVIQRVRDLLGLDHSVPAGPRAPEAQEFESPPVNTASIARLDDYFERLDQAFAARAFDTPAVAPEEQSAPAVEPSDQLASEEPSMSTGGTFDPALAGAFSALLAAEQSGSAMDAFVDWIPDDPEPQPATGGAPEVTDALLDTIVRRVLERLSDTVVRETVAAIASETTERLVREEIERIKSNIK